MFLVCIFFSISSTGSSKISDSLQGETVVKTVSISSTSWDGSLLPAYLEGQPEITILNIKIPPGTKLPEHKHPVINAGYLIRGSLTVVKEDGKILHMKAGDSIVELVNQWHYGKNEGTDTAEIVVFYAGKVGTPITIKK